MLEPYESARARRDLLLLVRGDGLESSYCLRMFPQAYLRHIYRNLTKIAADVLSQGPSAIAYL